ncbi:MAG TPA: M2 family metallopeptidase [Bryobacteraceae bacterium]|nr:M2 family metallopeptidase [Bryobacteraceae bacterium]
MRFAVLALAFAATLPAQTRPSAVPTIAEAKAFIENAERTLLDLSTETSRAQWVQSTYITEDTEILAALASERSIRAGVDFAKAAVRFDKLNLPPELRRKFNLLKLSMTMPTPADPKEAAELTRLAAGMEGVYGRGKYCPGDDQSKCLDLQEITRILATNRDPKQLLEVWRGWHEIAKPIRKDYTRFIELSNKGTRELGFPNTGAMWRSKYDMPPDAFAKEVDRLWEQVKPLYVSLHSYVRWNLREKYGADVVPERGPIPAHLLGNMWAQEWSNIYDVVAPKDADAGFDLTEALKKRNTDALQMVRYGEGFFTSLGFAPLPKTFWERSMFVKPRDREVVCHASAWDVDNVDDLRLKMCIDITAEDFSTVHHELGHNVYQRAYNQLPFLFRDSANDGFHEAIGDAVALSINPQYLVKLGLIEKAPDPSKDIGLLLRRALDKVAFLPFGLLIDQWRWKVFTGEITPEQYNKAWWDLRLKYQGVAPAGQRGEEYFDPGAKYHVPANVPYTRYFLAHILQLQFHRSLAQAAGCKDPLNRCSIYDNKEAGKRLIDMLEMGASRPWQDALQALTGQREMDATAIRDYFAPLQKWLDEQNKRKPVGW